MKEHEDKLSGLCPRRAARSLVRLEGLACALHGCLRKPLEGSFVRSTIDLCAYFFRTHLHRASSGAPLSSLQRLLARTWLPSWPRMTSRERWPTRLA